MKVHPPHHPPPRSKHTADRSPQSPEYIVVFKNYATNEQINHYMDMVRQSGAPTSRTR